MDARSKKLRLLRLLGLALAAAGAVLILTWLGLLDGLEASCLDARMKHWPTNPAAASLVQLDIDDRAIEQIGRWPWPRQRLAQLVRALDQAGAGQIALDITLAN